MPPSPRQLLPSPRESTGRPGRERNEGEKERERESRREGEEKKHTAQIHAMQKLLEVSKRSHLWGSQTGGAGQTQANGSGAGRQGRTVFGISYSDALSYITG